MMLFFVWCYIRSMKTLPTQPGSIRLPLHLWPMFRAVLRSKGRDWLERLIAREHKKIV